MKTANVLVIDDDPMICEIMSRKVKGLGHEVLCVNNLGEGRHRARSEKFDVVFLDVNLPDGNGLTALPEIRAASSRPEVIIITGAGEPEGAELAIRSGAWDYIEKPFSGEEVALQLVRVLQYREEKHGGKAPVALKREGIVGNSPRLNACLDLLAQASRSDGNVLLTGETGTGKEVFARAIHENSPRSGGDFVVVDCTVLPENLVESLLFGHRKGAFTGADRSSEGLVKLADGGTLFLDEVGELPLRLQKTFLRVIQERHFRPVGGVAEVPSDFRLVAATNRDLDRMARSGRFREDLLFRLRSFSIELPPLRERIGDIRALAMYHVARLCDRRGVESRGFSPEFFEALAAYGWPGNIRELVNALDQSIASEPDNPILFPKHLPDHIRVRLARESIGKEAARKDPPMEATRNSNSLPSLKELRDKKVAELERRYLQDLMAATSGNISEACRVSGLKRARLYELMKKYRISKAP